MSFISLIHTVQTHGFLSSHKNSCATNVTIFNIFFVNLQASSYPVAITLLPSPATSYNHQMIDFLFTDLTNLTGYFL